MRLLIIGSKDWTNYSDVMRQITVVLEDMKHDEDANLTIVHGANRGAEDMVTEYVGKVQKFMKQKGYSIKEELFRSSSDKSKSVTDYEMIQSGADLAIVFATKDDKRSYYSTKMIEQFNIPLIVIND
jgi:uncharacterized protein YdeI (YjbR/CyaY-like superfamily)